MKHLGFRAYSTSVCVSGPVSRVVRSVVVGPFPRSVTNCVTIVPCPPLTIRRLDFMTMPTLSEPTVGVLVQVAADERTNERTYVRTISS